MDAKIVISGGGTGGHLAIAKSLCEELNLRGIRPIFIGSLNGQDRQWFEDYDGFSERIFLPSSGVVNKRGLKKLGSLTQILKLALRCRKIFKNFKAQAVVSVGGYSAAPAAFASILTKTPLFIHEQNAIIGKLNKILKPFARDFFSSYDENSPCDYPVSERFFTRARVRQQLKCVLFLGGSQGAKGINEIALNLAPVFKARGIKIIHQCGKNALGELKTKYIDIGLNLDEDVDLFDFCKNIEEKMALADLAISRSGASSLWELAANNLPAIFVPFPYAANDHQYHNAKFLADNDTAKICKEDEAKADSAKILKIVEDFDIKGVSAALKASISKDGSKKIIDKILAQI